MPAVVTTSLERKAFSGTLEVKSASESGDQGIVVFMASVFGNKDSDGDIVVPGAFSQSIKSWSQKGRTPPVLFQHDWDRPIGKVTELEETKDGLKVTATFNLETKDGRETFSNIKAGIIDQYSFGYKVVDFDRKDGTRYLKALNLFEVSPVVLAANDETSTLDLKDGKSEVETKAEFLGDYAEGYATMAAVRSLCDQLFYNVMYDVLFEDSLTSEEKNALLTGAFNEFRDIAIRVASLVMQDAAKAQETGELLRKLWRQPRLQTKSSSLGGLTLDEEAGAALAGVDCLMDRIKAVAEMRAEKGEKVGEARLPQVLELQQKLAALYIQIRPKADEESVRREASRLAVLDARIAGVAIQ